ncbi:hypothetical protein LPJ53_004609 [Coemansia erecta]|uniref:Uncharacterized protein n=1 Tax=Coemansia erecta TaxID=147472 RepID=A0A9W7XYJ7_9FUNG|nr:hypothetical protein LPJ53_004609 [Coemansia erecta]
MACPNGGCNFTRMLLDMGSVRKYIYGRAPSEHIKSSGPGTADSSTNSSPFLSEKQLMDLETGSTSLAWQTKTPGALYFMLNSHAPIDARISQKVVSETLELAGKAADVSLPASEKAAEASINMYSSALAHGDEFPPSYHNISVNYTRLGRLHDASSAVAEKTDESSNVEANEREILPCNNTATDAPHHHEPATDAENAAPTFDQKLLEQNMYLMRSVRKLELTNQIIKEAYAAVQETLLAERQSKETQMQALERKHQDDMLKLVEEYQERAEQQQQQMGRGSSYLGSDSDLCGYDYDLSYRNTSSTSHKSTTKSVTSYPGHRADLSLFDISFNESASASSTSSRNSSPPTSPKKASAQNSSSAANSVPVRNEDDDEDDDADGISIMWERGSDVDGSDADTESIYSSSSSDDSDSDDDSDSGMDSSDDDNEEDNFDDGFGDDSRIVFGLEDDAKSISGSDSEHELASDMVRNSSDQNDDSEISDYSVEPSAPQLDLKHLLRPEDYADIDPAAAVISRYYANDNGTLDIAADIEDIPVDDDCDGSDNGDCFADSRFSESDDQVLDSLNHQSIWDAMRDPGMSGVVEDTSKSYDDREMERIVQLPADQRIAKFINRASSHLQQGARGGLSLGFMLYNLEMLSSQFASNHNSVLCAFVECLYRLTEAMSDGISSIRPSNDSCKPEAAMAAALPSALAKKNREDSRTLQQAATRIVKLLHTYITAPEDQQTVLQQLEKLSMANEDVRSTRHAMLLRAFYENELIDRTSISDWYGQQSADDAHSSAFPHAQLIRSKAAPLILELSDSAANNTSALEDLHHQLLNRHHSATGTNSSTAMSTPTHIAAATRVWAGSLTPVSDENATLTSQSSDSEYNSSSNSSNNGGRSAGTSVLNLGRKPDEPAPLAVDSLRPVKQVTFAAV